MASTLSEAIHGEVVALEQQTAHLDNQTKRLQTLMERELHIDLISADFNSI